MWLWHILLGHNVIRREAVESDYRMGHVAVYEQRRADAHHECDTCGKVW